MANSSLAFLFPGQGSQSVGMGKELADRHPAARAVFEEADEALGEIMGRRLSQICWEGPAETLQLTEITQPAILTTSVAALRILQQRGIEPACVAGHSLGEYSAHVAAGTLEFSDAVRVVRKRGKYMQEAVPAGQGAMAAILGMPLQELQEVCAEAAREFHGVCSPANINSPAQIVISGNTAAVEQAAERAKARGAKRAVLLPVSAPFHCSLMKPAEERLARDLQAVPFSKMRCPVMKNIDGKASQDPQESRQALIHQVTGAVQWVKLTEALVSQGIGTMIEVGPGKVLCGLLRQIDRAKACLNVEDEVSLQKALSSLAGVAP